MAGLFANLFGGATSNSPAGKSPSYSLQRLQQLYDRLSTFRESDLEKQGGGEAVVETVRQITEALVWGEHHDTNLFDFFCEKSILSDFIRVLRLPKAPKTVKVQLLQTLSMLVQNIRRQTSLYYLLSQHHVNHLISMPLDFHDEEILAYYITLLKSLAMRLDGETIKFFFIQIPEPTFPLYIEATKFFMHRDQMVRAAVRTITLQVYQIAFPPMRSYVLRHATDSYFTQLAYHLRDLWLRIDKAAAGANEDDLATLQHEIDLQQDLLIYLSDVFELGVDQLNEVLADKLISCAMVPVLLSSVAAATDHTGRPAPTAPVTRPVPLPGGGGSSSSGSSRRDAVPAPPRVLAPTIALFLIRQVFDTLRCRVLLEPLATALLQPTVSRALACLLPFGPQSNEPSSDAAQGDHLPNPLRERFLKFLECTEDDSFILAASVLHTCVRNRQGFSLGFLESARVVPPRANGRADARAGPLGGARFEVSVLLLRALQRHASWAADTFQVLVRIVLDVFLDPSLCHNAECYSVAVRTVHEALCSSAQRAWSFLQEALAGGAVDDSLLDVFLEEWELHRGPLVAVAEVCSNARRLLPHLATSAAAVRGPAGSTGGPAAQRAVRSFLLLRRLLADIVRHTPQVPHDRPDGQPTLCFWAGPTNEPSPLQVDPKFLGSFHEGMRFELGNTDRIVCGVSTPEGGKETRYLLLDDFWLLLVRPDLAAPGWAVVTTLWPLQQVQCLIDRGNPRLLMIAMQGYRTGPSPGESTAEKLGGPTLCFTTTLNFEDVRRCHRAQGHLQGRRWEVRARLLREAVAFVNAARAQPLPNGLLPEAARLPESE